MSYSDTKQFLDFLFASAVKDARDSVYRQLQLSNFSESQFHEGIEAHAPAMNLTSEQWFRIFQAYNSSVFRSRFDLQRLLSENQIQALVKSP